MTNLEKELSMYDDLEQDREQMDNEMVNLGIFLAVVGLAIIAFVVTIVLHQLAKFIQ